ncbi:hypothetical protein BH23GEM7_BH23GEM7_26420 [soil metagenome]
MPKINDLPRTRARLRAVLAACLLLAGCDRGAAPVPSNAPAQAGELAEAAPRYLRELIFVGVLADTPVVVPFSFSGTAEDGEIMRSARAWLAHGTTWESFLDASWPSPAVGSVWQILPHPELRVIAGGTTEIEALAFRRGERALRLHLGAPISEWNPGEELRYRAMDGRLDLRGTTVRGTVFELQRIERPATQSARGDDDWLFLTDGGSLRLLLAEATGGEAAREETFAWTYLPDGEAAWDGVEIRWLEMLPFAPARRDIPIRWRYRLPGPGIEGEVWSLGYDAQVGEERAGRRAVEVRYTVEGWVSVEGERRRVLGMIRHLQD